MENHLRIGNVLCLVIVLIITVNYWGCHRGQVNFQDMTPEQQFEYAKMFYDQRDYLKAQQEFTAVLFDNPASLVSEKAQFYLAESHYYYKEYILAASEYGKLMQNYPQSSYADDALYEIGMCYYKLAPGYALDQEYTNEAVSKFQQFLDDYPDSDLRQEVEKRLNECLTKLMKKEYENGEQYRKMGYYKAAIISYDYVLTSDYDTEYNEKSLYRKGECLYKLGDLATAENIFKEFIEQYPKSDLAEKVEKELEDINQKSLRLNDQSGENE